MLDCDIVNKRDGLGAHADQVVHIHSDAIDSDCVILVHELCNDRLRPYAVSTDRESHSSNVNYIGKVTNGKLDGPEIAAGRPSVCDAFYESAETDIGFIRVDTGIPVGGVGDARIICCHDGALVRCASVVSVRGVGALALQIESPERPLRNTQAHVYFQLGATRRAARTYGPRRWPKR